MNKELEEAIDEIMKIIEAEITDVFYLLDERFNFLYDLYMGKINKTNIEFPKSEQKVSEL